MSTPTANPHALAEAQTAHARAIKLRQLARREPMVRELLRRHESQHAALAADVTRLTEENAALREQLAAALAKPKPGKS